MITDLQQGHDDMFRMFQSAFGVADWTRAKFTPVVFYMGREKNSTPPLDKPYFRVTIKHFSRHQVALTDRSIKRYCNTGVLTVQSFGQNNGDEGLEIATYMAIMAEKVYEGKSSPNGVWFRRVRSNEIGPTGGWYQINTLIDFEYDTLR